MKQPALTAMLTAAIKCHRMLLNEKEDPKGFQDFMNTILWNIWKCGQKPEVVSYHLNEEIGRLRFIVRGDDGHREYELHYVDSETRMYGSSQSSAGARFRAMYGTMKNDWYCVRTNEDQSDLAVLTQHMVS